MNSYKQALKIKNILEYVYLCTYYVQVLWTVTKYYSKSDEVYETVDKCSTDSSWVKRDTAVFVFSYHHGSKVSAEGGWIYRRLITTALD